MSADYTVLADLSDDPEREFYGSYFIEPRESPYEFADGAVLAGVVASDAFPTTVITTPTPNRLTVMPSPVSGRDTFAIVDRLVVGDSVFAAGLWPAGASEQSDTREAWIAPRGGDWVRTRTFPRGWTAASGIFADHSMLISISPRRVGSDEGVPVYEQSLVRVPRDTWRFREEEPLSLIDTVLKVRYRRERLSTGWTYSTVPVAVAPDRFWVVLSKGPAVTAFESDGEGLLQVEWDAPDDGVVSRPAMEAYLDERGSRSRDGVTPDSVEVEEALRYRMIVGIKTNDRGQIFVRSRALESESGLPASANHWLMFDTDGALLGRVLDPEGVRILGFGEDYVLAAVEMEPDGEQLRRYGLVHDEGAGASRQ